MAAVQEEAVGLVRRPRCLAVVCDALALVCEAAAVGEVAVVCEAAAG